MNFYFIIDQIVAHDWDFILVVGASRRKDVYGPNKTMEALMRRLRSRLFGLISRNRGRGFIPWLVRATVPIHLGKRESLKVIVSFVFLLHRLIKASGWKGCVLYLKTCQVVLMQSVGNHILQDSILIGLRVKRSRSGLPLVIPSIHRHKIISGKPSYIKFWMSLFGIYRIMEYPGKLSLSSITDKALPVNFFTLKSLRVFIRDNFMNPNSPLFREMGAEFKNIKDGPIGKPLLSYIGKAGPTVNIERSIMTVNGEFLEDKFGLGDKSTFSNSSLVALHRSAYTLKTYHPDVYLKLREWMVGVLWSPAMAGLLDLFAKYQSDLHDPTIIGRLGLKDEPAGKIRVFAFVDAWTQWAMKPLHDWLFSVLRKIPTDGTFNQGAPLTRLIERMQSQGNNFVYSLDLSSATDRLPVWLQQSLLEPVLTVEGARYWKEILVSRPYLVKGKQAAQIPKEDRTVWYAVGQPMGALSSWAMLALTHHLIVQYCYWAVTVRKEGPDWKWRWFQDYAVLGDDVVIANSEVAEEYLNLMAQLGVGIGLHKSLLSPKRLVMEFAKRYIVDGFDCSPLAFKEVIATKTTNALGGEFMKKNSLSFVSYVKFLGYGYKVLGGIEKPILSLNRRIAALLVYLTKPQVCEPIPWFEWVTRKSVSRIGGFDDHNWGRVGIALMPRFEEAWKRLLLADKEMRRASWAWTGGEGVGHPTSVHWYQDKSTIRVLPIELVRRVLPPHQGAMEHQEWTNSTKEESVISKLARLATIRGGIHGWIYNYHGTLHSYQYRLSYFGNILDNWNYDPTVREQVKNESMSLVWDLLAIMWWIDEVIGMVPDLPNRLLRDSDASPLTDNPKKVYRLWQSMQIMIKEDKRRSLVVIGPRDLIPYVFEISKTVRRLKKTSPSDYFTANPVPKYRYKYPLWIFMFIFSPVLLLLGWLPSFEDGLLRTTNLTSWSFFGFYSLIGVLFSFFVVGLLLGITGYYMVPNELYDDKLIPLILVDGDVGGGAEWNLFRWSSRLDPKEFIPNDQMPPSPAFQHGYWE